MKKRQRLLTLTFTAACLAHFASAQTSTTRSLITGFELGTLAEAHKVSTGSVQSGLVRSGGYAYRANPVYSTQRIVFASRAAGGAQRQTFRSARFYLYVNALPLNGSVSIVKIGGAATFNPEVDLNPDGTLTLADSWQPDLGTSSKALTPNGQWRRIEFDAGAGLAVYVDGELWVSGSSKSYPAGTSIAFGAGESRSSIQSTTDLYFDDIVVDADSFSTSGFPGDGRVTLLSQVADPLSLNNWTGGAGSKSNLWMAVATTPPDGKPAKLATDLSQIKNAASGSNQDYKPKMQTYLDAGVPMGATIGGVMAICSDGQETVQGAKNGGIWVDENPAQKVGGNSFDYGDASSVIGDFPAGWASHYGPVSGKPAVDLAKSPVVAVRKASQSGKGVAVDFLGVYVDWR